MESASKRSRKKKGEFSGLHPSLRVKVKKLTVFLTPPPFLPFSHGDYPPISSKCWRRALDSPTRIYLNKNICPQLFIVSLTKVLDGVN